MTSFLVGVHDVASFFSFSKCHVSNPLPNYSNNWFKQLCQDRDLQQLSSLGSVCAAVISMEMLDDKAPDFPTHFLSVFV